MSGRDGHHDHHAPPQPDVEDSVWSEQQLVCQALEELLIAKGVITAAEMRRSVERLDTREPADGARLVARCWLDEGFAQRVLADANLAAREIGIETGDTLLRAVRNDAGTHNVIVCTLCSCYPSGLIGSAPGWYKSREYRARVVREPRAVLEEFGTKIPDDVELRVHDSSADLRYIVIPARPPGSEGMREEELAACVTRDCMIGTALPRVPDRES